MPSATTNAINALLGGLTITNASLHSGFPGATGANEVSGGSPAYARKGVTFGAASGGFRSLSAAVTFDVPATTVRWVGYWNTSTFLYYTPNGGATPREFVADAAADLIRSPAHGYVNTQKVVFFGGTVPGGLVEGTVYFVVGAATDTFQVSATSGGAAIDLTSAGTSDVQVSAIVEDVYASQGTHQLTTAQFGLPF